MRNIKLIVVFLLGLSFLAAGTSRASPAKFVIPDAFPGNFRIDFLGTDFKLWGNSSGTLSTESTIDFSVGTETSSGSGIYNISVAPGGFQFLGFGPGFGLLFDAYGAGTGTGTFDTSTGDWVVDMPTLFVNYWYDEFGNKNGNGMRLDFHLTTSNIWIPTDGNNPGYWTTTASPMVLDVNSPQPWGDLHLVAGGLVPYANTLSLTYDWGLINTIAANYSSWQIDTNPWVGIQYEFDIYGNDPVVSAVPVPAAMWLFGSGLAGLFGLARRSAWPA
ncbi:MAG: hypothetical protein A3A87_03965 [Candidatus Muproteobacteria bacterium RIFCSPLOWO2_01_FULL_60_18]|uniref:PEP-CTERM protein-sorting domain-containing protein n=1 Tax=Candidatus Muproteobacteria bacterium RIFCSPLOWO2_01_FULL_60_18 TaxID=1817768 RepID=A0A1F6U5X6_9PROT|nr:MAG: hypothetical protein A3A87_03965 [Candidatus Muproteobacteria bacterium RIFCSPLOWO2_01_FULL_60_18]